MACGKRVAKPLNIQYGRKILYLTLNMSTAYILMATREITFSVGEPKNNHLRNRAYVGDYLT